MTTLTVEAAEELMRQQTPAALAVVLECAARRMAIKVHNKTDKKALRMVAKHFSHVTMDYVPKELLGRIAKMSFVVAETLPRFVDAPPVPPLPTARDEGGAS